MNERERRIVDVLMALREGEVTTYGDVAEVAGHSRQSRLVGRILATTDLDVPWWRVVNASGRIVSGHPDEQRALLRSEGVTVVDDRVRNAPIGRFCRPVDLSHYPPNGSVGDLTLDLDEGEADVVQGVAHRRVVVAETLAEPIDQTRNSVDGEN